MLAKGYPLSQLQNCCQKGKYINLVCYSCLKHANEVLLGDPRQADQRAQTFNFSIVNHQPLDGTAQAPSSLPYMQACVNQSSTCSPLSGTNDRLHKCLSLYIYYSRKSLTHNIPGASAPSIILAISQRSIMLVGIKLNLELATFVYHVHGFKGCCQMY